MPDFKQIKIMNKDIEEYFDTLSPLSIATKEIAKKTAEGLDTAVIEACIKVNVDPDILIKQQKLIRELQDALDVMGNQVVGCDFTEIIRLRNQNERLRKENAKLTEKVLRIQDVLDGDYYDD